MYHRRRITAELRILFKDTAKTKAVNGYPRIKHNDRIGALLDILVYRYYSTVDRK